MTIIIGTFLMKDNVNQLSIFSVTIDFREHRHGKSALPFDGSGLVAIYRLRQRQPHGLLSRVTVACFRMGPNYATGLKCY